jgi:hypothetical protein
MSADVTAEEIEPVIQRLEAARPDIVYCGLGFPKQERFIAACRDRLPATWFLGCGAAVNFAAGYETRAPQWMQRTGLEWMHRLCSEPRRLSRRYAGDLPFALRVLLVSAVSGRFRRLRPQLPVLPEVVILPELAPATVTTRRPARHTSRHGDDWPAMPVQHRRPTADQLIDLTSFACPADAV